MQIAPQNFGPEGEQNPGEEEWWRGGGGRVGPLRGRRRLQSVRRTQRETAKGASLPTE